MARAPLFLICILCVSNLERIGLAAEHPKGDSSLPNVLLVGDSIRLSYQAAVAERLQGKAIVSGPKANGGDSTTVLRNLEQWVIRRKPDVVHFNCGIHDTKKFISTGKFQVPPEQYEKNLRAIVRRIRRDTGATVLFATTTPILDERAASTRKGRDYVLLDDSVREYNKIAVRVMHELKVPVNDLNLTLAKPRPPASIAEMLGDDGVHLTLKARTLAAGEVAEFLQHQFLQQVPESKTQPKKKTLSPRP